jgi:hypothetical protein
LARRSSTSTLAASPVADLLAGRGVPFLFATGYGEDCDTGKHKDAPVLHRPYDPDAPVATVDALVTAR